MCIDFEVLHKVKNICDNLKGNKEDLVAVDLITSVTYRIFGIPEIPNSHLMYNICQVRKYNDSIYSNTERKEIPLHFYEIELYSPVAGFEKYIDNALDELRKKFGNKIKIKLVLKIGV